MANWAIAFTCSAIALAAVTHHALCGPGATLSMVIAYVALAVSSYANLVCLGHFLRDAFTFKVFTAEKDATPLALMKLTHEAIRRAPAPLLLLCVQCLFPCRLRAARRASQTAAAGPTLMRRLRQHALCEPGSNGLCCAAPPCEPRAPCACRGLSPKVQLALERAGGSTAAARAFGALWDDLALVMHVHMCHEDAAIFPAADGWLPHHTDPFAEARTPRLHGPLRHPSAAHSIVL